MEEVGNNARDIIPTDEILRSFIWEGVLKREGWGVKVVLRMNIDNDTKNGKSS